MRTLLFSLLGSILLMGCAAEKRLGESRIEARRYSRGVHVQHHRSHHPSPTKKDEGHRSRWERPVIMAVKELPIVFWVLLQGWPVAMKLVLEWPIVIKPVPGQSIIIKLVLECTFGAVLP